MNVFKEDNFMRPEDLIIRTYATKEPDGSWYAICIDLNLFAQGISPEEVHEKIKDMVAEYVEEAFTTDREHFSDLIPRKAPFYFIMRYYFALVRYKINKKIKNYRTFIDPLPLMPARHQNL